MQFPETFAPVKIGSKVARNRLMRLPTTPMLAEAGRVGNQMLGFYEEVARGGVGTVVCESFTVRPRRHQCAGIDHDVERRRARSGVRPEQCSRFP